MTTELRTHLADLQNNVRKVVLGKDDAIRMCLVALLAGDHVLLEDVPGVGKTLLGRAIAKSISADFARIQFTPDLLPSDIIGGSIFDTQTSEFVFKRGPLFANIVLADEINRAPPRTQAALLEAMAEGQVSVDGTTYPLPQPFLVIATQNPFEFEGTYALPESQLDRFLMRISMGYPSHEAERQILQSRQKSEPVTELKPVLNRRQVLSLQSATQDIDVAVSISDYILDIANATRHSDELHVGVSTRGVLSWSRAAQASALIDNRDFVVPDDVKQLAVPVLAHRVAAKAYLHGSHRSAVESLIDRIVSNIPVPN